MDAMRSGSLAILAIFRYYYPNISIYDYFFAFLENAVRSDFLNVIC